MADAFASSAVACIGGLKIQDWLERNAQDGVFDGEDLVNVYSLRGKATLLGQRKRKDAAIILFKPEKWRNMALAWYYSVWLLQDSPLAQDSPESAEKEEPGLAADLNPALIRVVSYRDAMELSASIAEPIVVVPLFVQRSRPPRGSRFAVPLQFACDAVTAGAGGLAYRDDHIAVAYLNTLQTLCHHAATTDAAALPQWLSILGFLLDDLAAYAGLLQDVAALVEHLRASEAAPDMLQRALSFAASRRPFSPEERLRLLETVLKRTFKLHETLLGREAVSRVVSTLVLVPLLYGAHRRVLTAASAAAHFDRIRRAVFGAAEEGGRIAGAEDAARAAERRAHFAGLNEAARKRKEALLKQAGGNAGAGGAYRAADAPLDPMPSLPAKPPQPPPRKSTAGLAIAPSAVAVHEARLICLLASATGLLLKEEPARRLLAFCRERDELPATDGDADSDGDAASAVTGTTKTAGSTRASRWQFNAANPRAAERSGDWRAHMRERSELDAAAEAAARQDAARFGLWRGARGGGTPPSDGSGRQRGGAGDGPARPRWSSGGGSGGWDSASVGSAGQSSTRSACGFGFGAARRGFGSAAISAADADMDWRSRMGGGAARAAAATAAGRPRSGSLGGWGAPPGGVLGSAAAALPPGSPRAAAPPPGPPPKCPAALPPAAPGGGGTPPPSGPRPGSAPPPPSTATGRRWRVRNLGVRADLVGMGLIEATPLPFPLATGGIFRGELELPAAESAAAAAEAAPAAAEAESDGGALASSLAYPFVAAGPGAVAVRIVPEFASLPPPPPPLEMGDAEDGPDVELQVLVCIRGPELGVDAASSCDLADAAQRKAGGGRPLPDDVGDYSSEAAAASATAAAAPGRAPVTLLIVLDKSGSMADAGKMPALQSTVRFILDQLGPGDGVAVTAFDTAATTVVALGSLETPESRDAAHARVDELEPDGGTDITAGLQTALGCFCGDGAQPPPLLRGGRLTAVLLLTDGQDGRTYGSGEPARLAHHNHMIARASELGVPIHTFGFGADHDSAVLHHLAAQTGGSFAYVEDASQVAEAFATCLGGMTSCVTRDMALDLEARPGCRITAVSSAYAQTLGGAGATARVAFGTLYAEERREVLVTLRVSRAVLAEAAAARDAGAQPPALLLARAAYTPLLGSSGPVASPTAMLALPTATADDASAATAAARKAPIVEVDVARNRERATTALQRVLALHDTGELAAAAALLRETTDALLASRSVAHPTVMALVDELEALRSKTATSEGLDRGARAATLSAISTHSTQRFAGGAAGALDSAAAYRVSSQVRMILSARRGGGGSGAPSGGSAAAVRSLGWGSSRPRSNYDRAMAAEVRMEPQTGPAGGPRGGCSAVRLTGTITTAWSAVQVPAEGDYELVVRRLGIRADSTAAPPTAVVGGSGDADTARHVQELLGDVDALSADATSLVPALRIAFGNVLFGGSAGITLLHAGDAAAGAASSSGASISADPEAIRVDLGAPVELHLSSDVVLVMQRGTVLVEIARPSAAIGGVPAAAGAGYGATSSVAPPLLIGLENATVLLTRRIPPGRGVP